MLSRLATAFTLVPLVTILGLMIGVANVLDDASHEVSTKMHDVELAGSIENNLLSFQRMSNLAGATADEAATSIRREIGDDLREILDSPSSLEGDAVRADLVRRLRRSAESYVADRERLDRAGLSIAEVIRLSQLRLDDAVIAARKLRAYDRASVRAAETYADKVGNALIYAGILSIVITTTIAIVLLWLLRRAVLEPIHDIQDAVHRFRSDPSTRITTGMPTELHSLSAEVNGFFERLESQRRTLFVFLGSVAHDLRNPVAVLHASVRNVLDDPTVNEDRMRKIIVVIERQLARLNRLLDDLVDGSQLESGEIDVRLDRVDLRTVVREVEELFETASPIHRILVTSPESEVISEVDPSRMVQVVSNLVSNAIKYSPRGGRVDILLREEGECAVIAVSDQGPGIEPADYEAFFEPFRRSARSREDAPGAGLGLSVVKKIVEAHQGSIRVESVLGVGSTFTVRVPRQRADILRRGC